MRASGVIIGTLALLTFAVVLDILNWKVPNRP